MRIFGAQFFFSNNFQDLEVRDNKGKVIYEPFALHGPLIS